MAETQNQNKIPAKNVKPRGKRIQWSEEDLDEFCSAESMQRMADDAAADWKQHAPRGFKKLLDASEIEEA